MGLFSKIGGALGGPVGGLIGGALDIGAGLIGGGREKRGIDEAARLSAEQFEAGLGAVDETRGRIEGRLDPFTGAGTRATSELERLITGGGRLAPTAAETFATERAFEGIDRASAAGKRLFSGRRIEDFGEAAAGIGSQFRQQSIANLQDLAGRGAGTAVSGSQADINLTAQGNRLRELLGGNVASAALLKTGVDVSNIANIGSNIGANIGNLGNLLKSFDTKKIPFTGLGEFNNPGTV